MNKIEKLIPKILESIFPTLGECIYPCSTRQLEELTADLLIINAMAMNADLSTSDNPLDAANAIVDSATDTLTPVQLLSVLLLAREQDKNMVPFKCKDWLSALVIVSLIDPEFLTAKNTLEYLSKNIVTSRSMFNKHEAAIAWLSIAKDFDLPKILTLMPAGNLLELTSMYDDTTSLSLLEGPLVSKVCEINLELLH